MRWYRRILGFLLFIVILFLGVGFFLPPGYHVERSVLIEAAPAQIHEVTGDLRQWRTWVPWQQDNEEIQIQYGARTAGVGAQQTWAGQSSRGTMVVTHSDPSQGLQVDFRLGDQSHLGTVVLRYEPGDGGTRVSWVVDGEVGATPVERWFSVFMGAMTGPQFEHALERLRERVEANASS